MPSPRKQQPVGSSTIERFIPALLILLVLAVYVLAVGAEFIGWDDPTNVPQNHVLQMPGPQAVAWFWTHPYDKLYIPITYTVWTLLASVSTVVAPTSGGVEFNPFVFHAANVIAHALATVLVYLILRRRIQGAWACAAGAALFAIHPVQVEAVAWVTAMKDVLSGALALAAIWIFLQAMEPARDPASTLRRADDARYSGKQVRWGFYGSSVVLFALALLAKPSVVAAIPIVLVLYWLRPLRPWQTMVFLLLPWILLALPDIWITHAVQPVVAPADGGRWWLRPLIGGDALSFYFHKLLWPIHLGLFYDRTPQAVIDHGWIRFTWIFAVLILAAIGWLGRKVRWPVAAALLFVSGMLPVMGLIPFSFQTYSTVADHYLYLAMLGPALALAWGLSIVRPARIRAVGATAAALLLVLAGLTINQTRYWHDSFALFGHACEVNPQSPEASFLLASEYNMAKKPAEALYWFDRAAPFIPKMPQSQSLLHSGKATALINAGRFNEAELELEAAIQLDPMNQVARYNLEVLREKRARGTLRTGNSF